MLSVHKKHRFYSTVVLFYQFRYPGSQHTRAVLAFFLRFCYSKVPTGINSFFCTRVTVSIVLIILFYCFCHCSVQKTRPEFLKMWFLKDMTLLYFYSQGASFLLGCQPSLPVQICKTPKCPRRVSLFPSI